MKLDLHFNRIAKALKQRSRGYTVAAKRSTRKGDVLDTVLNTALARSLHDTATEIEFEAARIKG